MNGLPSTIGPEIAVFSMTLGLAAAVDNQLIVSPRSMTGVMLTIIGLWIAGRQLRTWATETVSRTTVTHPL